MGRWAWMVLLVAALASPAAAEWKSFTSLEATYQWSQRGDASSPPEVNQHGTTQIWYQAPNHYRLKQIWSDGEPTEVITIVGGASGVRVYDSQQRVVGWTSASNATAAALGMTRFDAAGKGGPFASFQQEVRDALGMEGTGVGGWKRLPDETVAGRRAMVLAESVPVTNERSGQTTQSTTKYWVDTEYGILLAEEDTLPGIAEATTRLVSLHVNPVLDRSLFDLDVPAGVITLKGPFPGLSASDLVTVWDAESIGTGTTPTLPQGVVPKRVLTPGPLPPGFSGFGFGQNSIEDEGKPSATWDTTVAYVNPKTGGFIQFTQGTSEEVRPQEKAYRQRHTTVRKSPATVFYYRQPYPHLALVWTTGSMAYSLEGSEVTLAQLKAMAVGMKPMTEKQLKSQDE